MPNVLPAAVGRRPHLYRQAGGLACQSAAWFGRPGARLPLKPVPQKVEPAVDSINERFVGVFLQFHEDKNSDHKLNDTP